MEKQDYQNKTINQAKSIEDKNKLIFETLKKIGLLKDGENITSIVLKCSVGKKPKVEIEYYI